MELTGADIQQICEAHSAQSQPFPAAAYTSSEFLKLEQNTLFHTSWVCVGFTSDVPSKGDIVPVQCGGKNLIITRADDDQVRVFHNFCRHRGMMLAQEPCSNVKRLVCPYHCWTYDLDGRLVRTPHIEGPGKHEPASDAALPDGLLPVATAIWHTLIFVDLSGTAAPFADHIGALQERWSDYDLSELHAAAGAELSVNANWKLAVENFIDVYHLPYVHPGLNSYSSFADHYYIREARLFGEGNDKVYPEDCAVGKFADFAELPETKQTTLEALCLFPNLLITITRDHLRVILVTPDGAEACTERVMIFVNSKSAATAEELTKERQQLLNRFMDFNSEDVEIVEKLQNSMHSGFEHGAFSPFFDEMVRLFQAAVVEDLKKR